MAVRVQLDQPNALFTNLDFIAGKAVLTLPSDTPISSIVIKLEGESRTRLASAKYPHNERSDKKRTELETHKLLYKIATVFPAPQLIDSATTTTYYTLSPGTYEYPFRFKFPFNNDCINNNLASNVNMAGIRLELGRDGNEHVRKALPPSISGFPGEAEIKYYVKVTVARPQFYKENYRGFADFRFLPIEPPRKKDIDKETYARRQHQFTKVQLAPEKKGLFKKTDSKIPLDPDEMPPRFSVDARLPSPPILTCHEPIPLRVLVKKLSESSEIVYLQLIQIELIGYTHIRAHDLTRSESGSWVILSRSNMAMPLGAANDPSGKEWKVDPTMWNQIPLPSSIAPSFDTCNISRSYELEVRIGLTHGSRGSMKPELIVLPLRMAVQVFSGIEPPQALLDAMGVEKAQRGKTPATDPVPPRPPRPTNPESIAAPPEFEAHEDAPPSYEDAMADALAPVDGPRREYNPLDDSKNLSRAGTDAKVPVDNNDGKTDDRLFPDSEPLNPSTESFDTCSIIPAEGSPNSSFPPTPKESDSTQDRPAKSPAPQEPEVRPGPSQRRVTPQLGIPNRKPVPGSKR